MLASRLKRVSRVMGLLTQKKFVSIETAAIQCGCSLSQMQSLLTDIELLAFFVPEESGRCSRCASVFANSELFITDQGCFVCKNDLLDSSVLVRLDSFRSSLESIALLNPEIIAASKVVRFTRFCINNPSQTPKILAFDFCDKTFQLDYGQEVCVELLSLHGQLNTELKARYGSNSIDFDVPFGECDLFIQQRLVATMENYESECQANQSRRHIKLFREKILPEIEKSDTTL